MQESFVEHIVLYRSEDGRMTLDVNLREDTLWLTQKQMGTLFETERSVITKHVNNIVKTGELHLDSVCANVARTAEDGKTYQTKLYNLDMILSVGYRVNSKRGTQFRIWATNVLRDHILKGYSTNQKRLRELNMAIRLIADIADRKSLTGDEATALLRVVADYSYALDLLDDYDHGRVRAGEVTIATVSAVTYEEAVRIIGRLRRQFRAGDRLLRCGGEGEFHRPYAGQVVPRDIIGQGNTGQNGEAGHNRGRREGRYSMGKKKEGIRMVLATNAPVSTLSFGGRSARIVGTPYPQSRINPGQFATHCVTNLEGSTELPHVPLPSPFFFTVTSRE